MSYDTERIAHLEREAEQLIAALDELRTFAENVRDHGLRADTTPTMNGKDDMYGQWSRYLQRIDDMIRAQAREALRRSSSDEDQSLHRCNTVSQGRFVLEAMSAPDPSREAQEIAKWIHRMEWRGDPIGARYIEALLTAGKYTPKQKPPCAHCGFPRRGNASVDNKLVCHADPPWPDCYRLITVHGEKLGSRLPREES